MANYVNGVVDTVLKIHETEESGDILAFLTGLDEVDQAVSLLSEHAKLIKDGKRKWMIEQSLKLISFSMLLNINSLLGYFNIFRCLLWKR